MKSRGENVRTVETTEVAKHDRRHAERGVRLVLLLTTVTMVAEIGVGYATGSMALLADGWHMATHVGALGLASAAYWVTRRYASHRAFVFGTGKVRTLAGYTSAIGLGLVAIAMIVESATRLLGDVSVDFVRSLPVATLGLVVNIVSVVVLQHHDHDHDHAHDHNHRAALLHVIADTFTSALAIVALLAGRYLGWGWLDAFSGGVGGVVIAVWSASLIRSTLLELLDVSSSTSFEEHIRRELEALNNGKVADLRVWSVGGGSKSCVATIIADMPCDAQRFREALARYDFAHLALEVRWSAPSAAPDAPTVSPPC